MGISLYNRIKIALAIANAYNNLKVLFCCVCDIVC